jgi:hypothetical protein
MMCVCLCVCVCVCVCKKTETIRERDRKISFQELPFTFVEVGMSKTCKAGQQTGDQKS